MVSEALRPEARDDDKDGCQALETVPCQSLATYRAEGSPFRVAVQDVVERIFEAVDPVATALSSYNPRNVAEAANTRTSDREVSCTAPRSSRAHARTGSCSDSCTGYQVRGQAVRCLSWKSAAVPAPGTPGGRGDGGGGHGDGNTPSTRRSVGRIQGCARCGGDPFPPSAPDFDDLVRRKVAEATRDMVRSHAENGEWSIEPAASQ